MINASGDALKSLPLPNWVKLVTVTTCAQCRLVLQHRTCRGVTLTDATGPNPKSLRALTAFPVYSR